MVKVIVKRRGCKPHPDFPLFAHARGYWAKKVRGRLVYFGKIADDPKGKAALEKWLEQKDDLLAGRTPRLASEGLTIRDLCNRFLTAKRAKLDTGELSAMSFYDYFATCRRIIKAFGPMRLVSDLAAGDFERFRCQMAQGWSPVTLANEIRRVKIVFHYAEQNQLVSVPVRFGSEFKQPARHILRKERQSKGPRMLEAVDLRAVLEKAGMPLRAMILLGINCGLGNADIASLPIKAVDLQTGWLNYPRPKTGIPRRCPLWPETLAAIRQVAACRSISRDTANKDLMFLTRRGNPWMKRSIREEEPNKIRKIADDSITKEFRKILTALQLHRNGLGFYALRHTFETIGGDSRDQVAVNYIMGHTPSANDMSAVYRERIDDDRLKAVTDHVHKWLFGENSDAVSSEQPTDTKDD